MKAVLTVIFRSFPVPAILYFLLTATLSAQETATLSGRIMDDEGREALELVTVVLKGTTLGAATDANGRYSIGNIPPGSYALQVSAIGFETRQSAVTLAAGQHAVMNFSLRHSAVELGEVLVYGASLRKERITESPAAISLVEARQIARAGGSGQLPKLLEMQPGIDMVQSGLYDFNVNTRGFNSSLNRRLLVLLDGRDLGTAFLGATEWNGLSTPVEDLGRIELVRGPGSALYGANAYNGVINITSTPPKAMAGTHITVGGGEMSAMRADVRHAGVAGKWSYRVNVGGYSGKTFSVSRVNNTFEYPGFNYYLNTEVIPLDERPITSVYGAARLDYEYENGGITSVEGGLTQVEREVIVTGIGRVQVQRARRPWGRLSYSGHGFNVNLWTNSRMNEAPDLSLSTGLPLIQDANISQGEVQYHFSALDHRIIVVCGLSQRFVTIDTRGTLMLEKRSDNMTGVFAQVEYAPAEPWRFIAAGRYDRSTLHDAQITPKLALVWTPVPAHSFRLTFNKAFQSPNYSELYLHVLHPTRPLAYYGNKVTNPPGLTGFVGGAQPQPGTDLTVEKITGYEIGYKGMLTDEFFVTADAYFSQLRDFVTDLAVGVNPRFPASGGIYNEGGQPTRTIWSYANAGRVEEKGVDVSALYYVREWLHADVNVSLFEFSVLEQDLNDVLLPNSPSYRIGGSLTYEHPDGHDVSLSAKYVPTFEWAAGIYRGTIPAYAIVNLSGTYRLTSSLRANISVSNLLDREHYEIFGGSLLGRRVIASITYSL